MKRSATRRLGKDIIWGADTLFIGLTVDSFWDATTIDVIYRFLALESQEWDIGLDAGLYVAGFSAGFRRDRLQLL